MKQLECHRCHRKLPEKDMINHFGMMLCKECIRAQAKHVYSGNREKR